MSTGSQMRLQFKDKPFSWEKYIRNSADAPTPYHLTAHGALFEGDCMSVMKFIHDETVDTVFADPPFNLGKEYRARCDDSLSDDKYISWCHEWLKECHRILKPGGSLFLYNLPKWNILLGTYLYSLGLEFRHWIAIQMSASLPIKNKLHPSHYSLLYYSKGKPKTFRRIRTPIETCRHCGGEIKDYGGHRKSMNPNGVTLKDVWVDIPPVRHAKYKSKARKANALSTKVLERVIEMSSLPDEVIFDPFGGSGTTYAVAEYTGRQWIGVELDYCDDIKYRLESDDVKPHSSEDYIESS